MKMHITIITLILGEALYNGAWEYCSDKADPASCGPCVEGEEQYKCPQNCNIPGTYSFCNKVCSGKCVNSECEYHNIGELICLQGCDDSFTGPYCQQYCMDKCNKCAQNGSLCLQCEQGRYGEKCNRTCNNCFGDECDMGGTCTVCKPDFYGGKCDKHCDNCKTCDKDGADCEVCDRTNGTCLLGCTDGYYGAKCDKKCHARCTQCNITTGECRQCTAGWFGKNCSQCQDCTSKSQQSTDGCVARCTQCGVQTGECQQCIVGWFGINCTQTCQQCKNATCSFKSGVCTYGCEEGFKLQRQTCQTEDDNTGTPVVTSTVGSSDAYKDKEYLWTAIVCITILWVGSVVVFVICLYKRRQPVQQHEPSNISGGNVYCHYWEIDDNDVDSSPCVNHEVQIEQHGHISSRNFPREEMASPNPCTSATADPQTRRTHAESILENHVYESVGSGGACAARMSTSSLAADEHQLRPRDDVRLLQGGNSYETRSLGSVTSEDLRLTRKTESMLLWEQNTDFSKVYVKYITPKSQDNSQ